MLLCPAILSLNPWESLSINYILQITVDLWECILRLRARFLAYPDTILFLPLLMYSPSSPPALCFGSLHSIDCFNDFPWPLAEYQSRGREYRVLLLSIIISWLHPFSEVHSSWTIISYSYHTVTYSYVQKLFSPWLLWPSTADVLPLFLVLGNSNILYSLNWPSFENSLLIKLSLIVPFECAIFSRQIISTVPNDLNI